MTNKEIEQKVKDLQELKRMREELDAEISSLESSIKEEMGEQEELIAGPFKILWKRMIRESIDTSALKKALPEIASQFSKSSSYRRFSIF